MRTYNPRNIPLARHLRKNMTPWERKLWYNYSSRLPCAISAPKGHWRLLSPISTVPAPALSLNWTVPSIIRRNNSRQMPAALRILPPDHLTVLRFTNLDIDKNFPGVCQTIGSALQSEVSL